MLPSLEQGDLVVLDRAYPSHEAFQELLLGGLDSLARVPSSNSFLAIDKPRAKGGSDCLVRLGLPEGAPEEWRSISVRLVRVEGPDDSETFFFTSLTATEFCRDDLRVLYHVRWEAEEFYKLFKSSFIGQGQFRSRSPQGVRQEIHAHVLYFAIVRVIMAKAEGLEYDEVSQEGTMGLTALPPCGVKRERVLHRSSRTTHTRSAEAGCAPTTLTTRCPPSLACDPPRGIAPGPRAAG